MHIINYLNSHNVFPHINTLNHPHQDAGLALIGDYGEKFTDSIIPMLEAHLTLHGGEEVKKNSKIQQAYTHTFVEDRVREGVVICLGNAA
eukprot:668929-Amorphochlora_amoeboformis.AAC.1